MVSTNTETGRAQGRHGRDNRVDKNTVGQNCEFQGVNKPRLFLASSKFLIDVTITPSAAAYCSFSTPDCGQKLALIAELQKIVRKCMYCQPSIGKRLIV
jgi:hypothetical protein